jgi:2-methylcitrate dehydratase PrpD
MPGSSSRRPGFTAELAGVATRSLPTRTRAALRRASRTALAVCLQAAYVARTDPDVQRVEALITAVGDGTDSRALFGSTSIGATWAALFNGIAIHQGAGFSSARRSAPIVGALLAVAASIACSGPELLDAVAIGLEAVDRIDDLLPAPSAHRAWLESSTSGQVAATVAAGRLLSLPKNQIVHAIAAASTQACGFAVAAGTPAEAILAGKAAFNAVEACLFAQRGLTGGATPMEGAFGFFELLAGGARDLRDRSAPRRAWESVASALYPSGPMLSADLPLSARQRAATEQIAASVSTLVAAPSLHPFWQVLGGVTTSVRYERDSV